MIVVTEALANARSRIGLTGSVVAGLVIGLLTVAAVDYNDVGNAKANTSDLVRAGYTTLYVEPDPESGAVVTAGECDGLSAIPGVTGATWLRTDTPTRLWAGRGPLAPTERTGSGILDILATGEPVFVQRWRGAAVLADSIAGVNATDSPGHRTLLVVDGSTEDRVDALVISLSILGQAVTGHLLTVESQPTGPVTACVVLAGLPDRGVAAAALQNAFPGTDGYAVRWALPNADRFPNILDQYQSRTTAKLWIVVSLGSVGLLAMYLRVRRNDYAFYRVAGAGRRRLFGLILCDLLLLVAVAAFLSLTTQIALRGGRASDATAFNSMLVGTARTIVATGLSAVVLAWFCTSAAVARPLQALKD